MSIDYSALKSEITTDPKSLGLAGKSDAEMASLLNAPNAAFMAVNPLLPLTALGIWAAKTGVRAKVEQAALNNVSPVQSPCLAIRDLLVTMNGPPFDVSNADNQAMVAALVSAGVMTAEQQTELAALGNKSPASRAEVLFGVDTIISERDVGLARNNLWS